VAPPSPRHDLPGGRGRIWWLLPDATTTFSLFSARRRDLRGWIFSPSLCFGQWRWWCAHDGGGGGVCTALVASTVCARQWWWWWWWRACNDGGPGVVRAVQLGWWGLRCWGGGASRWARGAVGIYFGFGKTFSAESHVASRHTCAESI
jgi:hypothetical protein